MSAPKRNDKRSSGSERSRASRGSRDSRDTRDAGRDEAPKAVTRRGRPTGAAAAAGTRGGPREGAAPGASEGERRGSRPKKKAGGARRTRQPARITKKSGDIRSLPDAGAEHSPGPRGASGPLSGRAIRYLRSLGHHLDPIVQIGKDGLTDAVVDAARDALRAHELVKVKVLGESPIDRKEAGPELAERTGATLAQVLGRTLLLYRRNPQKPKIDIPR